ncbi:MAG TPA: type II secretion system protein [Candidatus Paceibacterota bacterium]|jgi:prepilin-type N-terminal cleavage/methylation domain-containing protein|nr:type II secretion system protein [Candidatus Paceibacterota bacterium]
MKKNKGFTLIELLVVIAIIGILASVVLASLNSARNKGGDAAAKAQLANMRAQAEIYYDSATGGNGGGYSSAAIASFPVNACNTVGSVFDPLATVNINGMVNSANTATGNTATCILNGTNASKASSWGVAIQLKTANTFFCVDSTGDSKFYSSATSPVATAVTGASGTGAMLATGANAGSCN